MSAADDVRSILKDAGVPMTRKQILDALPEGASVGAAGIFLTDGRHRGELTVTAEDGKAHYTLTPNFVPTRTMDDKPRARSTARTPSRGVHVVNNTCAPQDVADMLRSGDAQTTLRDCIARHSCEFVRPTATGKGRPGPDAVPDPRSPLQRVRDHAENALSTYLDSVVDREIYNALIAARDAAERACRNAAP